MTYRLSFVSILTLLYSVVYSQCSDDFIYTKYSGDIKNNYPNFTLKKHLNKVIQNDTSITLSIDTSNISFKNLFNGVIEYKSNQFKERFNHYYIDSFSNDSALLCVNFIRDKLLNKTYYFTTSLNRYEVYPQNAYYLKDCFILFHLTVDKKFAVSIFSYKTLTTSIFYIKYPDVIGFNETSVFIQTTSDTRINKKKIKKGCLLTINDNGFEIFNSTPQPIINSYKPQVLFLSNKYLVSLKYLETKHIDCKTLEINSVYIKNPTKVIDSFQFDFGPWANDLNVDFNLNKLIVHNSNTFYHVYDNEKLIIEWKSDSWLDSLEILKYSNRRFIYYNDILFLELDCNKTATLGLSLDKQKTLNDIPFDQKATSYKLIIAFDPRTNKFLGYPKIVFNNGDI